MMSKVFLIEKLLTEDYNSNGEIKDFRVNLILFFYLCLLY